VGTNIWLESSKLCRNTCVSKWGRSQASGKRYKRSAG